MATPDGEVPVPRQWLLVLAEHLEAESAYFEHEGEPDLAVTLAVRAAEVRERLAA